MQVLPSTANTAAELELGEQLGEQLGAMTCRVDGTQISARTLPL